MAVNYQKITITLHYMDLKRKFTCYVKASLKEDLTKAFEKGLCSINKRIRRRSVPTIIQEDLIQNNITEQALSMEEMKYLRVDIKWLREDTASVLIRFSEQKQFHQLWFDKSMLEFGRMQVLAPIV